MNPTPRHEPEWLGVRAAARVLGKAPATLYRVGLTGGCRVRRNATGMFEWYREDLERLARGAPVGTFGIAYGGIPYGGKEVAE